MLNPQWLELPISWTNVHGPKDVWAIEVRLYLLFFFHKNTQLWALLQLFQQGNSYEKLQEFCNNNKKKRPIGHDLISWVKRPWHCNSFQILPQQLIRKWMLFKSKKIKDQPKIIIWTNLVDFKLAMLYTNPCSADPRYTILCKQWRSRSDGFWNWSGSALFFIKYVNLYP